MIDLSREGDVFVLRLDAGENRFDPDTLKGWNEALDQVESADGPKALVTTGTGKFYSNGLDLDYMGRPFGSIPTLMTRAEYVSKMLSVCHRCGGPGMFTQRVIDSDELVVLGATDAYESRCRYCYDPTEAMQEHLEL